MAVEGVVVDRKIILSGCFSGRLKAMWRAGVGIELGIYQQSMLFKSI